MPERRPLGEEVQHIAARLRWTHPGYGDFITKADAAEALDEIATRLREFEGPVSEGCGYREYGTWHFLEKTDGFFGDESPAILILKNPQEPDNDQGLGE